MYQYNELASNDYIYYFTFSYNHNYAIGTVTVTPYISNFISIYGDYYVKLVIILISHIALQNDYPNYAFDANLVHNSYFSYNANSFAYVGTSDNVKTILNNGFIGITAYYFYNSKEKSFSFNLLKTFKTYFSINFNGNRANPIWSKGQNFYLGYSWVIFPYYQCNTTHYVANYTLNLCYDGCLDGEYFNTTNFKCKACYYKCLTCINYDQCLTC